MQGDGMDIHFDYIYVLHQNIHVHSFILETYVFRKIIDFFPLLTFELTNLITNLVFIKYIEDKGGKLGGISKREELLVYLLKAHGIQLPTGTVFNEAFVPTKTSRERLF